MEVFYRQQTSVGVLWAVRGISTHGSRKGRNLIVRGKKGKRVRYIHIEITSIDLLKRKYDDIMQEYGSGRSQLGIQSNNTTPEKSKQSGGSAAEYLHFGRLIGESAEESSKRLEEISSSVKKDKRAELYLEKWSHEEEMSYQMFETLLSGDTEKSAAMRQLSFDSIMNEEDEEIEAAFESLVLEAVPEHAAAVGVQVRDPSIILCMVYI
ncbi:hypothetical protein PSENEW3_00000165 [Picochlorum sp. SENEW3]|nr:hypothetical protein PSENEW3_00000165 [Picochlorum sp. SENEW3]